MSDCEQWLHSSDVQTSSVIPRLSDNHFVPFLAESLTMFLLRFTLYRFTKKNLFANYFPHLITVDDRAVEDGRPVLHDIAVHGMLCELRQPLLRPLLA